jgi:signal transduction histidine kinase
MANLPLYHAGVLVDVHGTILSVNPLARQLFKWKQELDVTHTDFAQYLTDPETRVRFKATLARVQKDRRRQVFQDSGDSLSGWNTLRVSVGRYAVRHLRMELIPVDDTTGVTLVCLTDLTSEYMQVRQKVDQGHDGNRLLTQLTDGYLVLSAQGTFAEIDPRLLVRLRCTPEQLQGAGFPYPALDIINTRFERIEALPTYLSTLLQESALDESEILGFYIAGTSEYHWFSLQVLSGQTRAGAASHEHMILFRDVTQSQTQLTQLRRDHEHIFRIANGMREAIWVIETATGKNIFVNRGFQELFGIGFEKDSKTTLAHLLEKMVAGYRESFLDWMVRAGQATAHETVDISYTDSAQRTCWATVAAYHSITTLTGKHQQFILIFSDTTEQRELVEQLQASRTLAEDLSRLKSNVIANVNHEFRTPLTAIIGFTQLIQATPYADKIKDLIFPVQESAHRLHETLSSILDFTVLDSNTLCLHPSVVSPAHVLHELLESMNLRCQEKNVAFHAQVCGDPEIYTDARLLLSICRELLMNAIKFTRYGYVHFYLHTTREKIHIHVLDSGIGLPQVNRNRIFDPFRQGSEGLSRAYEGMGLGLATVEQSVRLMGGEIAVGDNDPVGSIFHIQYPLLSPNSHIKPKENGKIIPEMYPLR